MCLLVPINEKETSQKTDRKYPEKKKTNKMLVKNESETPTLDQMLKFLRRDVIRILAKLNQSESLIIEDELLQAEKWLASLEEYEIFDFIRSLALVATKLQPESFEDTKNKLIQFRKDVIYEEEWEDYEK
jgi:hypothetical protein